MWYSALPGSEPRAGLPKLLNDDEYADQRSLPAWRVRGVAALSLAVVLVVVLCFAASSSDSRQHAVWMLESFANETLNNTCVPPETSNADGSGKWGWIRKTICHGYFNHGHAVEDAMNKAMEALKRQTNSLKDPLLADVPSVVARDLNLSTNPCDNFYEFACGNWIEHTKIPDTQVSISRVWDGTQHTVNEQMKKLVLQDWPEESPYRPLQDWYQACMGQNTIEALGSAPLQPMLSKIEAMETVEDLQALLVQMVSEGLPTFFVFDVTMGFRDKVLPSTPKQHFCISEGTKLSRGHDLACISMHLNMQRRSK
jgi:hypothetical protein